jgi:hypothetical protein
MARTDEQLRSTRPNVEPAPSVATARPESRPAVEVEHADAIITDPFARRRALTDKLVEAIYLLFGVVNALIGMRVILRALGANPESPFAAFVYWVSAPFLTPFVGLFPPTPLDGGVLEWHAIVALIVYALVAWILARLVWLLLGETRYALRARTSSIDTDAS